MPILDLDQKKVYSIKSEDLKPIFKYMASRPFEEISEIINNFASSLQEIPEVKKENKDEFIDRFNGS